MNSIDLIRCAPKAELHLHIEGTLEPELMLKLADKHSVSLPYQTLEAVKQAYDFNDLQSFLNLYYQGAAVLRDVHDFYELMWRYLIRCKEENIVHCEIMFDPQTHLQRGIDFAVFINGFVAAIDRAREEWGQSASLIMCFLRDLSEQDAIHTLEAATPYLHHITAVGLDSAEVGNPPAKFSRVFAQAQSLGLRRVAHAGEEGPAEYIWSALRDLNVDRIDHGVRCIDDETLVSHLLTQQIPLTVCPMSNLKLKVVHSLTDHNALKLLERGLCITINSDDPAYFGGYLNANYEALVAHLGCSEGHVLQLIKNSFSGSFLPEAQKQSWLNQLDTLQTKQL